MKLTASQVKNVKPKKKNFKLADGAGMYLLVQPNGAKYWRLKYRYGKKEKLLALGVYPEISLAAARAARDAAKKLLRVDRDPSTVKRVHKKMLLDEQEHTFEKISAEWFENKISDKSKSYRDRTRRILDKDLLPALGRAPIQDISTQQLLAVLRNIERRTVDIAHRARQVASQIFRYAIASDIAERDIAADLAGALKNRDVKHAATLLDLGEIGLLLRSIDAYGGSMVVKTALQLSPLLFVRPGELRTMEWCEINWDKGQWEIPAGKMKTRQSHIVPLAHQSQAFLRTLEPLSGRGNYVFPSARKGGRALSDNGLRTALRAMGYSNEQITPHGFRAMARTLLDEELGFRPDYVEQQLAHTVKDPLGRAYNRTKHLSERTTMMQTWADFLDELRLRQ